MKPKSALKVTGKPKSVLKVTGKPMQLVIKVLNMAVTSISQATYI